MAISPLLRPLGIIAAVLCACQGLTWTVLTLLSILISTEQWIPLFNATQIFEATVCTLLFTPELIPLNVGDDLIMTGDVFLGFACFYMVISFIWMVVSLTMLWIFLRDKWFHAKNTITAWSVITGIITFFDFIVLIMLAVDYVHIEDKLPLAFGKFQFLVAIGSVMAIVTRGYVLWVAHAACAVFFFRWARQMTDDDTGKEIDRRPYINGFEDPWQTNVQDPRFMRGSNNQGFQNDERNFGRSVSQEQPQQHLQQQRRFIPPAENPQPLPVPQKPPKPKAPQVPQHQQGPYIPHPDYPNYSPNDLERLPRSALKTRSYYN